MCFHDAALWNNFNMYVYSNMQSCYNKCLKVFFGFSKYSSVTDMLFELGLLKFADELEKQGQNFQIRWENCINSLIVNFRAMMS